MRLKVSGVLVQNAFRIRRFDGLIHNLVSFIQAFWELHAQERLGLDAVDDFVGTTEPVDCTIDIGFQYFIVCALGSPQSKRRKLKDSDGEMEERNGYSREYFPPPQ